jgi:hypothetical protein
MKMEGRIENNGNQEKGKEEKEALRKSARCNKGTPKASPKFFGGYYVFAFARARGQN